MASKKQGTKAPILLQQQQQQEGEQGETPKRKYMNQYNNINPDDKSERLVRFQIHRKTAKNKPGKAYYQGMLLLPISVRNKLNWEKGSILALKVVGDALQIRKINGVK